jgi:hypothetical protein
MMKTFLKDLNPKQRKDVQSVLRGNGLNAKMVTMYRAGDKLVIELKRTGDRYTLYLTEEGVM